MADATKEQKKAQRAAKRAQRKQTRSQVWQAFQMQRKQDKALIPIMLGAFLGVGLLFFLIGTVWGNRWILLITGLILGAALAMFLFTRRLQRSVYERAEGQTGAAAWALENLRSGMGIAWRTKTGVAMTRQMDVLHRVVGVPGVVLVGEGNRGHLKKLIQQQERRIEKLTPGVPVHVMMVGSGEGEVPLKKLQSSLMKLPKVYKKNEVYEIAGRLEAMDNLNAGPGIPKGPLPNNGKMAGMNRAARRSAQRKQRG